MLYRLLADAVLLAHFAFIAFVVAGGLLAWRLRWAPLLHLPTVAWAVYIELTGGICPLTPLENFLRLRAGQAGYDGGFIEHYLLPLVYPGALTHHVQIALAAAVVIVNAAIYLPLVRRGLRRNR